MNNDCIICKNGKKGICNECMEKIKSERVLEQENGIKCLYKFDSELGKAFKRFKFNNRKHYARDFAKLFLEDVNTDEYDIVTYVPIDIWKYRKRGFNQVYEVIKHSHVKGKKIMIKRKAKQQSLLNAKERIINIKGKFVVFRKVKNKKILVFDDIKTTGATINEYTETLKLHGATLVDTITFLK